MGSACLHQTGRRRSAGGFTLVELMIVIVIIGILAAVGYPSYRQYALQTKRSDAHAFLQRIAQQEERYFSDNNIYTATFTGLGYASAGTVTSPEGYWSLTATVGGSSYTITAAPGGSQNHADDDCDSIILNSLGQRTAKNSGGSANAECW